MYLGAAQLSSLIQVVEGIPIPAAMVLQAVVVFIGGGIASRILWRLRLIRTFDWVLLILCLSAAFVWGGTAEFYAPGEAPFRFAQLLSFFLWFVLGLRMITRFILPKKESRTRASIPPLVRNMALLVLAFLILFVLMVSLFPEFSLTPVFFTSGVVSIVIGLAVQDILSNLLAGLVLSLDRPFEVGDWVHIGDTEGGIEEINWRSTRLRDFQGDFIDLPNSLIVKDRIVNHYTPTTIHLRRIEIGVSYDTPPGLVDIALLEAAHRAVGALNSPSPQVHFLNYLDSSLLYELRVWIDNYKSHPDIDSDLRREIWYAFKRHDITIPFPQRDVHFDRVSKPDHKVIARLVAKRGLLKGAIFPLTEGKNSLGRNPDGNICIPDPQVSNSHAIIENLEGRFIFTDLQSRHGTYVNGHKIDSLTLKRGDEITIGGANFTFETSLSEVVEGRAFPPH